MKIENKKKYDYLFDTYFNKKEIIQEFDFCNKIYFKLIKELSKKLNKIHNISWKLKSWEILIGQWLIRHISIINNRLNILIKNKKKNKFFFNKKIKEDALISSDFNDFVKNTFNKKWNEKLFFKLDVLQKKKKIDLSYIEKLSYKKFENHYSFKQLIFLFLGSIVNFFFNLLYKFGINRIVFRTIYSSSLFSSLNLCIKLREIPLKFFFTEINFVNNVNLNIRKKININLNNANLKERIIKILLLETLPTLYLEGFKQLDLLLSSQNLPESKTLIYSRNLGRENLFKYWLAKQISNGSKLIFGQHGSEDGLFLRRWDSSYESRISNFYLTWGNKLKSKNAIQSTILPMIDNSNKLKKKKIIDNKNILIIPGVNTSFLIRNMLFYKSDEEEKNAIFFAKNLNKNFRKKVIIKKHPFEYRSSTKFSEILYRNFENNIFALYKNKKLSKLIPESKVCIFVNLSTDFFKNLAINHPSIYIMKKSFFNFYSGIAHKKIKDLEENNIVFTNGKKAAEFLNKNYDNLEKWWFNYKTQKSIKSFTKEFANTDKKRLNIIIKSFKKLKKSLN